MGKKLYESGPPMPAKDKPPEPPPKESDFSRGVKKLIKPTENIDKKLKEIEG
jgi:hypothetical protein